LTLESLCHNADQSTLLALRMRLTVALVLTTLGFLAEANPRPKPDPLTVKAHVAVNVKPGEADAQESGAGGARGGPTIPGCKKAKSSCDPKKDTCCGTCVVDAREGKEGFVCDPRKKPEIMRDSKDAMRGGCGVMKIVTCGVKLTPKLLACTMADPLQCVQDIIAAGVGDCKDCVCALVKKVLKKKLPPLCP